MRILQPSDRDLLAEVYRDAVISQAHGLYSTGQLEAWANHGWRSDVIEQALRQGFGLASISTTSPNTSPTNPTSSPHATANTIEAFGVLEPQDRLALLYCRGRSCRQGRSSALVRALEQHAQQTGCQQLRTEASQLSRPLLERLGWQVEAEETVLFAGILFTRWRMIKQLLLPTS